MDVDEPGRNVTVSHLHHRRSGWQRDFPPRPHGDNLSVMAKERAFLENAIRQHDRSGETERGGSRTGFHVVQGRVISCIKEGDEKGGAWRSIGLTPAAPVRANGIQRVRGNSLRL
jgi:hypothetical protein